MLARRGENHLPVMAFKQRHSQPGFQLANGIADGRRYTVQFLGGRAKAATACDRIHHFQRIFRPHNLPSKFLTATGKFYRFTA